MILANFSHQPAQVAGTRHASHFATTRRRGFTLVEMLVAISITLVLMATVVGVFATVSQSVQNRRAAIEVGSQLRHVRNVLQRDLEGATCPTLPWTRPESNVGYFEIVEGLHSDFFPSDLTDSSGGPTSVADPEIDHATSTVPSSNLPLQNGWVTDGGGLGDYDDILAFTSRNEEEPFAGRVPDRGTLTNSNSTGFADWGGEAVNSPVAEVIWFCIENPAPAEDDLRFFGEAGFRTIYRRTLLVAPWLDYRFDVDGNGPKSRPGVLRIIDRQNITEAQALAALVAFQERYDISARIEFDPTIDAPDGRWTIVANTLADLTNRKNRYEHHGLSGDDPANDTRSFPYVMASAGGGPGGNSVYLVNDPELYASPPPSPDAATAIAEKDSNEAILGFDVNQPGQNYLLRPLAIVEGGGTARVVITDDGQVAHLTTGLVPLGSGSNVENRRGQDLMISDALAFDVQVFDSQAPVYALRANGSPLAESDSDAANLQLDLTSVGPADPGWIEAIRQLSEEQATNPLDNDNTSEGAVVSYGGYVDLGYRELHREVRRRATGSTPLTFTYPITPFAGLPHAKSLLNDARFTRVYDTWNFAYENDGVNQDQASDNGQVWVDEGTNGFDDPSWYDTDADGQQDDWANLLGPDDPGERETSPPYPVPLRAVQIKLRVYEADSRQMREVTVRQHFVPE